MNKLETNYNGGFPLVLDDLRFIQDSWRRGFEALSKFKNIAGDAFIDNVALYPPRVTGTGPFTIEENWVYRDGEIWYVPETSSASIPLNLWISFPEVNDPEGSKIFEDTNTNETYKVRQATISTGAVQPPSSLDFNALRTPRDFKIVSREQITLPDLASINNGTSYITINPVTPNITIKSFVAASSATAYIGTITQPGWLSEIFVYIEQVSGITSETFLAQNRAGAGAQGNIDLNRADIYRYSDLAPGTAFTTNFLGTDQSNQIFSVDQSGICIHLLWDEARQRWRQANNSSIIYLNPS